MDTPKVIENLFYSITLVSTFTCIVRSDYNFAFGLLCYYMLKTSKDKVQTARPVRNYKLLNAKQLLFINAGLILFDIIYCITMGNVWAGKPLHNEKTWKAFDNIRTITLILSWLNIIIRVRFIMTKLSREQQCSFCLSLFAVPQSDYILNASHKCLI